MTAEVTIADVDGDVITVAPDEDRGEDLVRVEMWPDPDDAQSSGGYVLLDEDMVIDLIRALQAAINPAGTEPAKWRIVRSDVARHVRLVGANGEKVMVTETYTSEGTAVHAIRLAQLADPVIEFVDERTGAQS